ncbi:MAG: type II toxin-antitoxin system prevent-host-death family antitoxin [Parvularculaceae bacterium]|nr:type II toxin-antitoxin system prevent-host-death family antitoxin [Parvularculaceae bacterium]
MLAMPIVNMHKAKTELSRLVEAIEKGEVDEIIIARNGKPAARLTALEKRSTAPRLGFLEGEFKVPDDFDDMGREEIEKLFYGGA